MLLYRTQISRTDNGILVLFRKILWQFNGNLDFSYPTPRLMNRMRLNNADIIGRDTSALAEGEDKDAGTGAD